MKPMVNSGNQRSSATTTSQVASTSFSGAVFNNCTIIVGQKSPVPAPKRCRHVIEWDDENQTCKVVTLNGAFANNFVVFRFNTDSNGK